MKKFKIRVSGMMEVDEVYIIEAETIEVAKEQAREMIQEDHWGIEEIYIGYRKEVN